MWCAVKGELERPIAYVHFNERSGLIRVFGRSALSDEEMKGKVMPISQSAISSIVHAPFIPNLPLGSVRLALSVLNTIAEQHALYAYTVCEIKSV